LETSVVVLGMSDWGDWGEWGDWGDFGYLEMGQMKGLEPAETVVAVIGE
jgi:hypothetical protein